MSRINPSKAWCFTLNNYTEIEHGALVQLFLKLTDKYFFICGKEVGASGTPHLQGYIEKRQGRFRPLPLFQVLRANRNAMHFERAKGNRAQNYKYCSKDNKFVSNIPPPIMTYNEAKVIWKETKGISNEKHDPATINEAALHIQFIEEYEAYSIERRELFKQTYNEMMKKRYPGRGIAPLLCTPGGV